MKILNKIGINDERLYNKKFNIQIFKEHKISNEISIYNFTKNKKNKSLNNENS